MSKWSHPLKRNKSKEKPSSGCVCWGPDIASGKFRQQVEQTYMSQAMYNQSIRLCLRMNTRSLEKCGIKMDEIAKILLHCFQTAVMLTNFKQRCELKIAKRNVAF